MARARTCGAAKMSSAVFTGPTGTLAARALTARRRLVDGRDEAEGGERAREEVADARPAGDAGRAPRRAGRGDDAAHALRDDVEGRPFGVRARSRARIPEAADGGVDETRVPLPQALVADAEPVHHADLGVLDHRVHALGEAEEGVAVGLGLQVEDDAPLVPGDAREVAAVVAALAVLGEGRHAARHVALRRLDLDSVRAEVGEEHRAEGAGEGLRQAEEAEVGERARRACHRAAQWLRRFTRTVRSPSKTMVPSCFVPQCLNRTRPASSRSAARVSRTSV